MKQYLRQWAWKKKLKHKTAALVKSQKQKEKSNYVESIKLAASNSIEYTVFPEIQKIFEDVKESDANSDCHRKDSTPVTDYVVVANLLGSLSKIGYSERLFIRKKNENEPCSSQQAADRDECQISWLEEDQVSDFDNETARLICTNYLGPKPARDMATLHSSFLISREDSPAMSHFTEEQQRSFCSIPVSKTRKRAVSFRSSCYLRN